MTGTAFTNSEILELDLIESDAHEVASCLGGTRTHQYGGALVFPLFPLAGFVAEETHNYFASRRRSERVGRVGGALFDEFGAALKKVRARVKLLDDEDTGPERLVAFMELARTRSRVLFAHPTSRLIQVVSGPFRPDLGAFFWGDNLIATSHTALLTMGYTREVLNAVGPGEFSKLGDHSHEFAMRLGQFFDQLQRVLAAHGRSLDVSPALLPDAPITSNDFVSRRFYRHASKVLGGTKPEFIPALTACLAQTNQVLHAVPKLLPLGSPLLQRMGYLTAYHASSTLRTALRVVPPWLELTSGVLENRALRNLMAHYELRQASHFALGASDPYRAAIQGVAGLQPERVDAAVAERLERISELLGARLTKSRLQPSRAPLGDHS